MPALDDDREESLAQELAKGASQANAYITAGYPAKNNNVAAVNCNRLLKKRKAIAERSEELRIIARTEVKTNEFKGDIESMTKLLLEDREFARDKSQPGAAVSASSALMKEKPLGDGADNPIHHVHEIRRTVVDPKHTDS